MPILNDHKLFNLKKGYKTHIPSLVSASKSAYKKGNQLVIKLIFYNCNYENDIVNFIDKKEFSVWVKEIIKKIKNFYVEKNHLDIDIQHTIIDEENVPTKLENGEVFINSINSSGRSYVKSGRIGFFFKTGGSINVYEHEFGHFLGLDDRYNYAFYYKMKIKQVFSGRNLTYIAPSLLSNTNGDVEFVEEFGWLNNLYSTGKGIIEKNYYQEKIVGFGYENTSGKKISNYQKKILMDPDQSESLDGSCILSLFPITKTEIIEDHHKTPTFKASFIGKDQNQNNISDWNSPEPSSTSIATRMFKENTNPPKLITNPKDQEYLLQSYPNDPFDNWLLYTKILFSNDNKLAFRFCLQQYLYKYLSLGAPKFYTKYNKLRTVKSFINANNISKIYSDTNLKYVVLNHLFLVIKNFKLGFKAFDLLSEYDLFVELLEEYFDKNSTPQKKQKAEITLLKDFDFLNLFRPNGISKYSKKAFTITEIIKETQTYSATNSIKFFIPKYLNNHTSYQLNLLLNAYKLHKLNESGHLIPLKKFPFEISGDYVLQMFNLNKFYDGNINLNSIENQ